MVRNMYIILMLFFITVVTSCNQDDTITDNKNVDEIKATNEKKTIGEKSLELKDYILLIDNQSISEMTYNDVIKHLGEPINTRVERFHFPATVEYSYFAVLCYDSIEIKFYLANKDNLDVIKPTDEVWGFELTGSKYYIGELRVGMSVDEYLKKFGNSKKHLISDLYKIKSDPYNTATNEVINLIHVLTSLKPENYYSEYKYVYYEQGLFRSKDFGAGLGFALLVKDNKIDRIVFGNLGTG